MANELLYGFHNVSHLLDERVTPQNFEIIDEAIMASLQEHNRQWAAFNALFAEQTTAYQVAFRSPININLQPLDEHGRARPVRRAGRYTVAFPLLQAGTAWGRDWRATQLMTVQEVNDLMAAIIESDIRWNRYHALTALFDDEGWTFEDEEHGTLDIVGLANDDTVAYHIMAGAESGARDDHYFAQSDAISDGKDPFPALADELIEHPENGGGAVLFLYPRNLATAIEALNQFEEDSDPNIRTSITSDLLVGTAGVQVPGTLTGYHKSARAWMSEWRVLPDNYIIGVSLSGPRPLRFREHQVESLRGFTAWAEREDAPFWERQFRREGGYGGWNRVGAVVQLIGSSSYAPPSGYVPPRRPQE